MIKFVAGIIVGAVIMLLVLCLIGVYRENVKLSKQIQKINQDWANNDWAYDDAEKGKQNDK